MELLELLGAQRVLQLLDGHRRASRSCCADALEHPRALLRCALTCDCRLPSNCTGAPIARTPGVACRPAARSGAHDALGALDLLRAAGQLALRCAGLRGTLTGGLSTSRHRCRRRVHDGDLSARSRSPSCRRRQGRAAGARPSRLCCAMVRRPRRCELLDAARKVRARARGAELGGRAWREAPRSRAHHLSWLESQRQITPHSSQDVTPELMGLAGYIMARSNSAHKLPGYIRRDASC